jgi:hypothetical protein
MCSIALFDRNKYCTPFHLEEEKQDGQAEAEAERRKEDQIDKVHPRLL